jgi:uncharacterized membrane protein YhaH (DUF805 family)
MEVYMKPWSNFANFNDRASRREYWTFVLINMAITIVLNFLARQVGVIGILSMLFSLAIFVPSLAVGIRRLHDTGKSGWMFLLAFIPIIGWLILLIFMLQESGGDNQYGAVPND